MAKLDFPVATADGQEFIADTGVIYTYVGTPPNGHWTGVSMPDSGQSLDSRFVQVIGDAMTGQLTLPGGGNDSQALQKQEIETLITNAEDPLLGNYLRTDAAAGAQTVQSTSATEFKNGVKVSGGTDVGIVNGLQGNGSGDYLALISDSKTRLSMNANNTILAVPDTASGTGVDITASSTVPNANVKSCYAQLAASTSKIASYTAYTADMNPAGTATTTYGYFATVGLSNSGDTAYGFYSALGASGSHYNFYASGTAPNYFAGLVESAGGVKVSGGAATVVDGLSKIPQGDIVLYTNSQPRIFISQEGTVGINDFSNTRALLSVRGDAISNDPNTYNGQLTAFNIPVSGAGSVTTKTVFGNACRPITKGALPDATIFNIFSGIDHALGKAKIVQGYHAENTITDAGTDFNAGFYSSVNTGTGTNYNFYASGTAPNYFKGVVETQDSFVANATNSTIGTLGDRHCRMNSSANPVFNWVTNIASERTVLSIDNSYGNISNIVSNGRETVFKGEGANTVRIESPSDYRLKTDINPISSAANVIKELNPVTYRMIAHPDKLMSGFIAHELQEQVSEAVTGAKDGTKEIGTLADYDGTVIETAVTEPEAEELTYTEEVETDGVSTATVRTRTWSPTGARPVYQGVDQTKLIPLLTKALQEALERIEALEAAAGPAKTRAKK